jgi:hypothetical protein
MNFTESSSSNLTKNVSFVIDFMAANMTHLTTMASINVTTTTPLLEEEPDEPLGVSLGMFAAILFGSLLFIFVLLGACVIWHTVYMKCLKRRHL